MLSDGQMPIDNSTMDYRMTTAKYGGDRGFLENFSSSVLDDSQDEND